MTERRERDFLSRWSRLKREQPRPEPETHAEPESAPVEDVERPDAEILAEHGLPDPDDIGPDDDISGFMKDAIPRRLRNRALRKLWLRNPVLANLDELVDYGEDYTDAATVAEAMVSAWQAGRGYLKEAPAEPSAPPETQITDPVDEEEGEGPAAVAETAPADEPRDTLPEPPSESAAAGSDPSIAAPARRRMAFRLPGSGTDC